ncbi:MAG: class I adenylate-forming enzyme family protein [Anaerocolumna sp.]
MHNLLDFVCNNLNTRQKIIDVGKGDKNRIFYKTDLILQAGVLSKRLIKQNVQKSDRVVLIANNSFESVVAFLAISNIGAIVSMIPMKNTYVEIKKIMDKIKPKLILLNNGYTDLKKLTQIYGREVLVYGESSFSDKEFSEYYNYREFGEDDTPVSILFSSGTTNTPKGVVLPYRAYINNIVQIGEHIKLSEQDFYLAALPFSFIAGQITSIFAPLHFGSNVVICNSQNIKNIFSVIENYGITKTNLVPTLLFRILHFIQPADYNTSSIQFVLSGGAACSTRLIQEMTEKFHIEIIEGYGSTEAGCGICINDIKNPLTGSVGKVLPGHEIEILQEEGNRNQGIIKIKSDTMMLGYFDEKIINKDGWYLTSDIGYFNDDHFLHIVGRRDDVIKCCGEKVYLSDIQEIILSDRNVENAVVIGIEDEERNKIPVAFVKLVSKQAQTEFQSMVDLNFNRISIPQIVYVNEFPTTHSEKISYRMLEKLYKNTKKKRN